MKNKYNVLVAVLVLVCLADAAYRLYRTYQKLTSKQDEVQWVKYVK